MIKYRKYKINAQTMRAQKYRARRVLCLVPFEGPKLKASPRRCRLYLVNTIRDARWQASRGRCKSAALSVDYPRGVVRSQESSCLLGLFLARGSLGSRGNGPPRPTTVLIADTTASWAFNIFECVTATVLIAHFVGERTKTEIQFGVGCGGQWQT